MSHNLLSDEHMKRLNQLRDNLMANSAIEPGDQDSLVFYALALAGEGGELLEAAMMVAIAEGNVANTVKKIWRDGDTEALRRKLKMEIADNIIYLQHLCDDQGIDPDECVHTKLELLRLRWPEHFER